MESFMVIIVDEVSCKMEPNWFFLEVIWTLLDRLGTVLGCSGGHGSIWAVFSAVSVKVEAWRFVLE